jgi:CRISPR type IV-associated protein Csf1
MKIKNLTPHPLSMVGANGKRPWTATQLFAGVGPSGTETCFYCGGSCEPIHPAKEIVKSSFTGLDTVTLSDWVCPGCVAAMQEKMEITLVDGQIRTGQKIRGYSWVITDSQKLACTKSHRAKLQELCTNPPQPPFVICLSDSGQKHLLYRAVVNLSRDRVTVTLEGEVITYRPTQLIERIELCKMIAAATGKPAMKEAMTPQSQMRIVEHFESEEVLAAWLDCFSEPLTRLAVWLCPAKEECRDEYPAVTQPEPHAKHRSAATTPGWFD